MTESRWTTIYQGDCRDVLPTLDAESVQCVVTSPPYWGLRSYLPDVVKLRDDLSMEETEFVLRELQRLEIATI